MTQTLEHLVEYPQKVESDKLELIEKNLAYLAIVSLDIEREDEIYDQFKGNIVLGYN